ncbi:MAG: ethanolamine ammonia-lyase subunit EutC [Deltaproteobacteria bacterium]|nr:ethanolamine ammonia-lyase subunit EutC [Deltaproteobacteria bacterium]
MKLDDEAIATILRAVQQRLAADAVREAHAQAHSAPTRAPSSDLACDGDAGHACTASPRPVHSVREPVYEAMLPRLVQATSSQIAVGHSGLRFRTDLYLRVREGHADARDAVHSHVAPEWPVANNLIALKTRCHDKREYLLYPNQGRRLDDLSRSIVSTHAQTRPDVQILVGDGLSPNAITQNGARTLAAITEAIQREGWRIGVGFYVEYARIGVADEVGVLVGARATVMLVGERPGLGTGDSLSVYIAIAPRLDQDNAEKNCISNVRPIGIAPSEAAEQTVQILRRGFETGVGGVALGLGWGRR